MMNNNSMLQHPLRARDLHLTTGFISIFQKTKVNDYLPSIEMMCDQQKEPYPLIPYTANKSSPLSPKDQISMPHSKSKALGLKPCNQRTIRQISFNKLAYTVMPDNFKQTKG